MPSDATARTSAEASVSGATAQIGAADASGCDPHQDVEWALRLRRHRLLRDQRLA